MKQDTRSPTKEVPSIKKGGNGRVSGTTEKEKKRCRRSKKRRRTMAPLPKTRGQKIRPLVRGKKRDQKSSAYVRDTKEGGLAAQIAAERSG